MMQRPLMMDALEPRALLDAVTWTGSGDGTSWHDTANWDVHRLPGPADDVRIEVSDADPVIRFGLDGGTHQINSLECSEQLQIEGGELRATQIAHFTVPLLLMNGAIGGGVWEVDQGITSPNGRWTSHMAGPIEIRGDVEAIDYAQLSITGGLALQGTMTIGSATYVNFDGPQKVSSGNFVFLPTNGSNRFIQFRDDNGGTLEFAEQVTISGGAQDVAFIRMLGDQPLTIVNRGTITSNGEGVRLNIYGGRFENHGSMGAVGGSYLWMAADFQNFAAMSANGATLTIGYRNQWINTGHIAVDEGTLVLDGLFTPADVAPSRLSRTGGRIEIAGELNNQGNTLVLDDVTGSWWLNEGAIVGGAIETRSSALLISDSEGRLVGPITVKGDIRVESSLWVGGDLTLDGEIELIGNLVFETSGGVYGGIIRASSPGYINRLYLTSPDAIDVVLGAGVQIFGDSDMQVWQSGDGLSTLRLQGFLESHNDFQVIDHQNLLTLVNEGTIEIGADGVASFDAAEFRNEGHLTIAGSALFEGEWSSPGTIDIQEGTWILGGTTTTEGAGLRRLTRNGGYIELRGAVLNTGDVLTIDAKTGPLVLRNGTITGGTIELRDGHRLLIQTDVDFSSPTLKDVEHIQGDVEVTGQRGLRIEGGLTIVGTMSVYSVLYFIQPQTVGASLLEFHGGTSTLNYYSTSGGDLVFAPGTTIRIAETATWVDFDSYGSTGQVIRSQGRIEVYNDERIWFECEQFVNEGALFAGGRALVWIDASGDIDAASELVRGTWHLADQARLELRNQEIVAIGAGATLVKSSPQSIFDGLSAALNRIDGAVSLSNGAWLESRPAGGELTLGGRLSVSGPGSFFEVNGNLLMTTGAELDLELADHSLPLRVTGLATLAGQLRVSLSGGFMLADGDSVSLIRAGSTAGSFESVTLPDALPGNKHALRIADGTVEMLSTDLADADLDGEVDSRDIILFLTWWSGGDPVADTNGDGLVDTRDVILFLGWWSDG